MTSRPGLGACALVALACADPATALPPPPPVTIVTAAPDGGTRALAEALVGYFADKGELERGDPAIPANALARCLTAPAADRACLRDEAGKAGQKGALVVVTATPVAGAVQRWTCVGTGKAPTSATRQSVEVDVVAALVGKGEAKLAASNAAYGCIIGAAAESGW